MNKRFHKRALSAAVALLTLTSAVTTVNAAQKNKITIECEKSSVSSGESFDVSLNYEPDGNGASGFTIDFHYNSDALTLNIPTDNEYSSYDGFIIVTNYEYEDGVVRLVGANLNAENVTDYTQLADFSFTVNDGYTGSLSFETSVETLVYTDGEDFVNADYDTNLLTISGPSGKVSETVTTTTTTQTTTKLTEAQVEEENETESEAEIETTQTTTTAELPETVIPTETDISEADTAATNDESKAVLFTHEQSGGDYNNEEALQYIFSPSDYTSSEGLVDISVDVSCSSNASGGIGMLTSSGWKIYNATVSNGGATWTAQNVDLSDVSGDMAIQLYYVKNGASFSINSISFSSSGSQKAETTVEENVATTTTTTTTAATTTAEQITTTQASTADTQAAQTTTVSEEVAEDEEHELKAELEDAADASKDEITANDTVSTVTISDASVTADEVESAVESAAAQASDNPNTGISAGACVSGVVIALCLAQIFCSTYSLIKKKS